MARRPFRFFFSLENGGANIKVLFEFAYGKESHPVIWRGIRHLHQTCYPNEVAQTQVTFGGYSDTHGHVRYLGDLEQQANVRAAIAAEVSVEVQAMIVRFGGFALLRRR